jgi:hypothetical protein
MEEQTFALLNDKDVRVGQVKVWYHSKTMISAIVQLLDAKDKVWETRKNPLRSVASIRLTHPDPGVLRVDYEHCMRRYAACMRMLVLASVGLYPEILDGVTDIRAFSYGHQEGMELRCPEVEKLEPPRSVPRAKVARRAKKTDEYEEIYAAVLELACQPESSKRVKVGDE